MRHEIKTAKKQKQERWQLKNAETTTFVEAHSNPKRKNCKLKRSNCTQIYQTLVNRSNSLCPTKTTSQNKNGYKTCNKLNSVSNQKAAMNLLRMNN